MVGFEPTGNFVFRERAFTFSSKPSKSDIRNSAKKALEDGIDSFSASKPKDLEWEEPCILGFILDSERCEFFKSNGKANAIHFPDGSDINVGPLEVGKKRRINNGFGNADIMSLNVAGKKRDLLTVENHHISADDGKARSKANANNVKPDYYKFDIYFRAKFDEPSNLSLPMIIDPGGRNTGPPTGP